MSKKTTYKNAGVDIDKANDFVERIKPLIKTTARKEVVSGIGGFGGLFRLDTSPGNNRPRSRNRVGDGWGQER